MQHMIEGIERGYKQEGLMNRKGLQVGRVTCRKRRQRTFSFLTSISTPIPGPSAFELC